MRIAYIVPSLANQGPVIVVRELVAQMVGHGHECVVFYFDKKAAIDFDCPTCSIVQTIAMDFTKYDIVHSHGLRPDTYVAKFREYSGKVRYVSTIHNYVLEDFAYQYNWLVAQIFGRRWMHTLRKLDTVVALSHHAMEYYLRWFPSKQITYAYNTRVLEQLPLDTKRMEAVKSFQGTDVLIGVNALLTRRKGVDLLLHALVRLPGYKLWVVGDGKEKKNLEKFAKRLGVEQRCHFAGYQPNAYQYLPLYDIFALPSRSEGFPLALLEAAVYGRPTVASSLPIVKECFDAGEVAIFDVQDIDSLESAIRTATHNLTMGQNLHQKYLEEYSPQKMYERYLAIYHGEV